MSRSEGRRGPRTPSVDPEAPESRGIGASDRTQGVPSPIPGGRPHLTNHPSTRQDVPRPAPRGEYRGVMAHGVHPGSATTGDRADMMRGPNDLEQPVPRYTHPREPVRPVPVYIVAETAGPKPLRTAVGRHITVPGFNADPVCICGVDPNRTKIRLMNTDASNTIRIAGDLTALIQDQAAATARSIGGALLNKGMVTYQDIETQDELWAVTQHASATVTLEIIMETSIPGAG